MVEPVLVEGVEGVETSVPFLTPQGGLAISIREVCSWEPGESPSKLVEKVYITSIWFGDIL